MCAWVQISGRRSASVQGSYIQKHRAQQTHPPDIFEHVEHLGGEVRVGHVKFSEVGLQHGGRRLLGLQGWHLLLKAQDSARWRDSGMRRGGRDSRNFIVAICAFRASFLLYFLAMLSIFCFFFRRDREDEDVPTREDVDCET